MSVDARCRYPSVHLHGAVHCRCHMDLGADFWNLPVNRCLYDSTNAKEEIAMGHPEMKPPLPPLPLLKPPVTLDWPMPPWRAALAPWLCQVMIWTHLRLHDAASGLYGAGCFIQNRTWKVQQWTHRFKRRRLDAASMWTEAKYHPRPDDPPGYYIDSLG